MAGKYISDELKDRILNVADLRSTMDNCIDLKKKGREWIGECKSCGSENGMRYVNGKGLFRCVKCEDSGKYPIQYLSTQMGMKFHDALLWLADNYNIEVPDAKPAPQQSKSKRKKNKKTEKSFRDKQLESSAIPEKAQQYQISKGDEHNTMVSMDRYRSGRLKEDGSIDSNGDDMILVYRDLEGQQVTYRNKKGKQLPFYRVRHKYPERHISSKTGKEMKYMSPAGSESVAWFSEYVLRMYAQGATIPTLFIVEGEKKADVLGAREFFGIGLMGIHNLSVDSMPYIFETIIRKCNVLNVVFLFDSDWKDISLKDPSKSVDLRPKNFCSAAVKFKQFFWSYIASGEFNLNLLIGTHRSDEHKGIDDFLCSHDKPAEVLEHLKDAITSQNHINDSFDLTDVTNFSAHKIREIWDLHSEHAFMESHKDLLKDLAEFKLGQFKRKYNHDKAVFELAEALHPTEKFWKEWEDEKTNKTKYSFHNIYVVNFFQNRGIGNYMPHPYTYQLIHIDDKKMIKKVDDRYVHNYIIDFCLSLERNDAIDIAQYIKGSITKHFSVAQLKLLSILDVKLKPTVHNRQLFILKDGVVDITQDKIEQRKKFSHHYFESDVIHHEYKKLGPLFHAEQKEDGWNLEITDLGKECEFLQFLFNTSCTYWRDTRVDELDAENTERVYYQNAIDYLPKAKEEDQQTTKAYFITKMLATGYLLHDYDDLSLTKAVICNDLKEGSRKESNGGTGKSIFATMFEHVVKFFFIDAGKRDLMNGNGSRFLFEGVDKETKIVCFDDIKDDFDFQTLFAKLTYGLKAEGKQMSGAQVGRKKYIITLNGQIKKNDASAERRKYNLGFTDFYNKERTPHQYFGHNLFQDWDKNQWNLWLNFIMQSSQLYLKYKLSYEIPRAHLDRRLKRLELGDNFLDWMDVKFMEGPFINHEVCKTTLLNGFIKEYPSDRKYYNARIIKKKIMIYAEYREFDFNIRTNGERITSSGKEYICISNEEYSAAKSQKINNMEFFEEPAFA